MKIGYARVSTEDQNLDMQLTALKEAGCEKIFQEKKSGRKSNRPALNDLLSHVRSGDEVIVWKLDRLGRSMKDLVNLVSQWKEEGIGFRSITDNLTLDGSPMNNAIFHIFAAMAQMESDLSRERTMAGLAEARRKGRVGGRPPGLSQASRNKAAAAKTLYLDNKYSVRQICEQLNISSSTLYKYLRHEGVAVGDSKNSSKPTSPRNDSAKRITETKRGRRALK